MDQIRHFLAGVDKHQYFNKSNKNLQQEYISGRYDKHYLGELTENSETAQPIR